MAFSERYLSRCDNGRRIGALALYTYDATADGANENKADLASTSTDYWTGSKQLAGTGPAIIYCIANDGLTVVLRAKTAVLATETAGTDAYTQYAVQKIGTDLSWTEYDG